MENEKHWRLQVTVNHPLNGIRGSIPWFSTKLGLKVFMDAHQPVTLKEGDRYPLRPPEQIEVLF